MAKGTTRQKKKARLMQVMNITAETSFSDFGEKEVLTDFTSSTIDSVAMVRNVEDYTLCEVYVLYKGRINLRKKTRDMDIVIPKAYVYFNVDVTDYRHIRSQALRGNSIGKAVSILKENCYEYEQV
tara:strand:+ start:194 stop:571 length:378 start_codon:yes stop_codon:yes gene_type:complete